MRALSRIAMVLVEPREAGNIGSVARAMHNMGISKMILVRPPAFKVPAAYRMALGGKAILDAAVVEEDLDVALAPFSFAVATSRRDGRVRAEKQTPRTAAREILELGTLNEIAVIFGREDRGLTNREIERCQRILEIPAAPGKASLNLAQAVMIVAYELFLAATGRPEGEHSSGVRRLAPHRKLEALYEQMEQVLLEIDYLHRDNPKRMMRVFRRILGRGGMDEREVRAWRGVFHQMELFARGNSDSCSEDAAG